ncbi:GmrSD restriction endonuclease domain-containing protein [Morganella sp. B601]|uniref:GmrSD restriction endonuclease domain-containing protein n=1 Tax=Morganella sp. B601 TaxID=3444315 RepID=UPI003EBFD76E
MQLDDFWEDIIQLDPRRVHYTGVVTLEPVAQKLWQKWEQDEWIIEGVGFKPFYIVDGQQRLTTSVILIQAILESVGEDAQLNYQSLETIRSRYVLHKADDGQRQSF